MRTRETRRGFIEAFVDACYRAAVWTTLIAAWTGAAVLGVSIFASPEVSVMWKVMSAPGFGATMLMLTAPFLIGSRGSSPFTRRVQRHDMHRPTSLAQLVCSTLVVAIAAVYVAVGLYLLVSDMDWLWKIVVASIWAPVMVAIGALWLIPPQTTAWGVPVELMEAGRVARDIFILHVTYENEALCKVCGGKIGEDKVLCRRCYTPHHRECWTFNGQCAVYACGEKHFYVPKERRQS